MKVKCNRCKEYFNISDKSKTRCIVDYSANLINNEKRVNHIYYLCPTCVTNFNKWISYTPKKKGEK